MNWLVMFLSLAGGMVIMGVLIIPIGMLAKKAVDWPRPWGVLTYMTGAIIYFAGLVTGLVALASGLGLIN